MYICVSVYLYGDCPLASETIMLNVLHGIFYLKFEVMVAVVMSGQSVERMRGEGEMCWDAGWLAAREEEWCDHLAYVQGTAACALSFAAIISHFIPL